MFDTLLSALLDTFLVIAAVAGLLLVLGAVLLLFFDTDSVKKRQLKKLATHDYEQARGTAHRLLLEQAAWALLAQIADYQRKTDGAKKQMKRDIEQRDAELKQALVRWLVENHLQEVPGIGDRLKREVIHSIFKGNLDDLREAYLVLGIGQQKQQYINQWIKNYNAQIPYRLQQHFPGKLEIGRKYQQAIEEQVQLIEAAEKAQEDPRARLIPIDRELRWLKEIEAKHFIRAYLEPGLDREDLDRYQIGVFAEWETMPDWFRAEMATRLS